MKGTGQVFAFEFVQQIYIIVRVSGANLRALIPVSPRQQWQEIRVPCQTVGRVSPLW